MIEISQEIKERLYTACKEIVNNRAAVSAKRMDDAQQASNQETKSSAGDKYETSRSMMQQERDKFALSHAETLQLKQYLYNTNISKKTDTIRRGSLIQTNKGLFFIAAGIGKVELDNLKFFVISTTSPLGKALNGKKKGDKVNFRETIYQIEEIV